MKKRLSTIFLLLILALTFVTLGCPPGAEDLDMSKVKKWNDLQSLADKDLVQCIKLENDTKVAIDWWIITDTDGMVLECGKDYWIVNDEGQSPSSEKPETLAAKGVLYLKFNKADDVVVWIHQNIAPKDVEKGEEAVPGSKDFRGRVNIEKSQGFEVKASKYREEVPLVGVIKLTCNETGKTAQLPTGSKTTINDTDCYAAAWSGDYKITEVWPLAERTDGPGWEAVSGLKFAFELNEGETKQIVYPAGNSIFALKQPDRFEGADLNDEAYEMQKNWYWCLRLENDGEDKNEADGYFGPIVAHEVKELNSRACKWHFDIVSKEFSKSALGETYIIEEADIVDGADIK